MSGPRPPHITPPLSPSDVGRWLRDSQEASIAFQRQVARFFLGIAIMMSAYVIIAVLLAGGFIIYGLSR